MWKLLDLAHKSSRFTISNISKKKFKYSFQTGLSNKPHPKRNVSNSTDKILVSDNLIIMADHGNTQQQLSIDLDQDRRTQKFIDIINNFFMQQKDRYTEDPISLVNGAMESYKASGLCTLTLCMMNAESGDVTFYYVGNNLYGIFKKDNIVMVQGLYYSFNKPYRIGQHQGFVQKCSRQEIKDDLIVIGSNGLWDNLNLEHIHYLVRGPYSYKSIEPQYTNAVGSQERQSLSLIEIANKLSSLASIYSRKGNYESPLYKMAQKDKLIYPKEGFLDDVSVVIARIKKDIYID